MHHKSRLHRSSSQCYIKVCCHYFFSAIKKNTDSGFRWRNQTLKSKSQATPCKIWTTGLQKLDNHWEAAKGYIGYILFDPFTICSNFRTNFRAQIYFILSYYNLFIILIIHCDTDGLIPTYFYNLNVLCYYFMEILKYLIAVRDLHFSSSKSLKKRDTDNTLKSIKCYPPSINL